MYLKLQTGRAKAVTPSDTANIEPPFNGPNLGCVLYVGGSGNLRVLTVGGDDVTFVNIPAGYSLPVQVVRVFATNTTATSIIALW